MMQDRLLLQEDSGDGTSISVPAGRHISTAFQMMRKMGSDRSTISQSTDADEEETPIRCCCSHLGHSGNHHHIKRNQRIRKTAIRESLVAAADYRFCPCRILHDVPPYRKQILWQDCLSACQGEDMADIPCSWMDTDRFHDGPWNRIQVYSRHSARFYSIFLFRTRTYASVVFL